MSGDQRVPELSVVVVAFNGPALLERCLASLERQARREGAEVLTVGHDVERRAATRGLPQRFPWVRWVATPPESNVAQMRWLGITSSLGRIVAPLEDDCVVSEGWCDRLIEAHRHDHVAVGGAVEPGAYARSLDWAVYLCEYGRFMLPLPETDTVLPGTNVSYKRAALIELLDGGRGALGHSLLEGFYETFVHRALQRAGRPLKMVPTLVVYNVNSWAPAAALAMRYHHGRGFAGLRVAGRPLARRLPFLALAGVLPVIQTARVVKQGLARRRHLGDLGRALPWIVLCALSWSAGEFMGYLLGPGESLERWR